MNCANQITLVRLILIPIFAYSATRYGQSILSEQPDNFWRLTSIAIFLTASLTDWLDGHLARRYHLQSTLGKILDPVADKLLTLTALSIFTTYPWHPNGWQLPWWLLALTILRDIIILGGVSILHFRHKLQNFTPTWLGKTTTVTQMTTLALLMLHIFPPTIPSILTAFLTTLSGIQYLQKGLRQLRA